VKEGRAIHDALGKWPVIVRPLSGGCIGEVSFVEMPDGERLVAKIDEKRTGNLEVEARMLRYLQEHVPDVPSPDVVHSDPGLLLMSWLPGTTGCGPTAEHDFARVLAALHGHEGRRFGFEFDTVIGPIPQPNTWSRDWPAFFGEHRLAHCARLCRDAGQLDKRTTRRIEELSERLGALLPAPERPSLLHGDLWSGNVMTSGSRVTGLIDPALYYGHPEAELAFLTLFRTVGDRFFHLYRSLRGIDRSDFEEFLDERRHLYNLYPLLVHLRLFGEQYLEDVHSIVGRFAVH
jgi:fructosamine-3-kinase